MRVPGILMICALLGSACSPPPEAQPVDTTVPTRPVSSEFKLPPISSGATAETNFDELYRDLDALRVEATRTEDPAILAAVSSDLQTISSLQAEADDATTIWDRSTTERVIDKVDIFSIVDENNVLLRVEDNMTGVPLKRDLEGVVVEEGEARALPNRTHIVWLERETGGAWYLAAEYWVSSRFPATPDDFEVGPTRSVDGKSVAILFDNLDSGTCLLLTFAGAVPRPVCLYPETPETNGLRSRVRYSLDRSEAYETLLMVSDGPTQHSLVVDGVVQAEFELALTPERKLAFWAAVPDLHSAAQIVPLETDEQSADDAFSIDLDARRAEDRSSFKGTS